MNKLPLNVRVFSFMIAPAELYMKLMAYIFNVEYLPTFYEEEK